VHNPGSRGLGKVSQGRREIGTQGDISLLNINQIISSVAAGKLSSTSACDSLVVGTQTNVLGYDVMNNRDMFYKDVSTRSILYVSWMSCWYVDNTCQLLCGLQQDHSC